MNVRPFTARGASPTPPSAVSFVSWQDPQDVENTLVRIAPKADAPSANPEPPFRWLYGFQAQHIAALIGGVSVEGCDDALTNPWVETVGFFEGALSRRHATSLEAPAPLDLVVANDPAGLNVRSCLRQSTIEVIVVGLIVEGCLIERDERPCRTQPLEDSLGSGQIFLGKLVDPSVQSVSCAHVAPRVIDSTRVGSPRVRSGGLEDTGAGPRKG